MTRPRTFSSVPFASGREIRLVRRPGVTISKEPAADATDTGTAQDDDVPTPEGLAVLRAFERVYNGRLDRLGEQWAKLQLSVLEAEALWGTTAVEPIRALDDCVGEIRVGISEYFWLKGLHAGSAYVDRNPERVMNNRKLVYDFSTAQSFDTFATRVNEAVGKIEEFYRSRLHLRAK